MRPSLAEKWSMRRRSASDGMDGIGMSAIANYRDIDLGCPQRAASTRKRARPRRIHQIINCPASDLMKSADRLERPLGKHQDAVRRMDLGHLRLTGFSGVFPAIIEICGTSHRLWHATCVLSPRESGPKRPPARRQQ